MELLGLILAFPAVLLANVVYALFVQKVVLRFRALWPWVLCPSRLVVGLLVLDVASVATIGAVASRQSFGPLYTVVHVLVVLFGAPAVANLLLIPGSNRWYRRWYVVAVCCFVLGMCLVFFQVGVGDALYGPDGIGGPFSQNRVEAHSIAASVSSRSRLSPVVAIESVSDHRSQSSVFLRLRLESAQTR